MTHLFVGMLLGILAGLAVGSACAYLAWAKAGIRSTKTLLFHKQYKNLCAKVNDAEDYHEKKEVIFRCIEPVICK